MTDATTDTATQLRHDTDTAANAIRHNTIASITLESGSNRRTVQRWLSKCGDIGLLKDGTRYFSDAEKDELLAHKSTRAAEVVEAELMPEPGAITLRDTSEQATGLMRFDIQAIELDAPTADLVERQSLI